MYLEQIFGNGAWNIASGSISDEDAKKIETTTERFVKDFCIPFEDATKKISNDPELLSLLVKKLSESKLH